MAIVFDEINRTIVIEIPQTEVTIQNLINAIRNWEDELANLDVASLAKASGKQDLGGGVLVGITLELINNWRIQFEERLGPDYIPCKVLGGNLVAMNDYDNNPIKPSAYTQVTITQSSSATVVTTGGTTLTEEEHDQLMDNVALEETARKIREKTDTINWAAITFIRHVNAGNWKIENNQMIFYKEKDTKELARFNLYDKKGKPAETNVFERKRI